jgi:hypothetical protein
LDKKLQSQERKVAQKAVQNDFEKKKKLDE